MIIEEKVCYVKSTTYNIIRGLYFQGVDSKKLEESGDYFLMCGGIHDQLRDIFLLPWDQFFRAIRHGELINTFKPPKEYWQYKFKIRSREKKWYMKVQGNSEKEIEVTQWHFNVNSIIQNFREQK